MMTISLDDMRAGSAEAANLMRALSHEGRLLVMCALCEGEHTVGALAGITGLSQSALSQHLAKLREGELVATRREGQTIHYTLAQPAIREIISVLHRNFCPA